MQLESWNGQTTITRNDAACSFALTPLADEVGGSHGRRQRCRIDLFEQRALKGERDVTRNDEGRGFRPLPEDLLDQEPREAKAVRVQRCHRVSRPQRE